MQAPKSNLMQSGGGGWGEPDKPKKVAAPISPAVQQDSSIDPWTGLPKGGTVIDAPKVEPKVVPLKPDMSAVPGSSADVGQFINPDGSNKLAISRPVISTSSFDTLYPKVNSVDEAALREQELARQQARISAINALYDTELQKARERAYGRQGTQRALSASRGVLGSDFGQAEQAGVSNVNAAEEQALQAQRNAEIQGVYGDVNKSVQNQVAQAKQESAQRQQALLENQKFQEQQAFQREQFDFQKAQAIQAAKNQNRQVVEANNGDIIDVKTGEIIFKGGVTKDKGFMTVSPGSTVFDPITGKPVYTAPEKSAGIDRKIVKIDGQDYLQNLDGSFSKPELPRVASGIQVKKADDVITLINDLYNDPNLPDAVGPISSRLPTLSGQTADFEAKLKNLIAKMTLDALPLLKGPMSDKDIEFLKQQATALSTNMSEEGFKSELQKLKDNFEEVKRVAGGQSGDASGRLKQFFLSTTPENQQKMRQIEAENPNISDGDILKIMGQPFDNALSMAQNGSQAEKIAAAIKQVESGGNYNAKGASGESGAYQFMPATWSSWASKYIGNANAPQTPENQDIVAKSRITELLNKGFNPQQIALIWNGGEPVVKKGTNSFGVKYDSGAYANKVTAALSNNT